MRAALALAAALSLAACRVDVEGAPCDQPGSAEQCPPGQACGVDLECSERAAQCTSAEQRCTPLVDTRCSGSTHIETCTAADPCGAWELVGDGHDCAATKLVCDASGGSPACVCPPPTGEIRVDASSPAGGVTPTGAFEPAGCRFKTLGAALAYARDVWQPASAGAPVTVRAMGTPAPGAPVVFEAEAFPLVVAPGVTLAAGGAAAADWVIAASPPDGRDLVQLHDGATLEGFAIRAAAPATGRGIVVSCGSDADAVVKRVLVDGGNALSRGVSVTGSCGLAATDLRVSSVAGPGVYVDASLADAAAPTVGARIDFGWIEDNAGAGVEVRGGALTLNGVNVRRNGGFGVKARTPDEGPKRAIALELNDSAFEENGEAGLLVSWLEPGSSVKARRSTFTGNKATTAETELAGRRAGGVFLNGVPPATLVFQGNKVYANRNANAATVVDQLVVNSGGEWNLSGPESCGASSNVFACPGNGHLVHGTSMSPTVRWAYWPTGPGWPYPGLIVNAHFDPPCAADPAPIPLCPAP